MQTQTRKGHCSSPLLITYSAICFGFHRAIESDQLQSVVYLVLSALDSIELQSVVDYLVSALDSIGVRFTGCGEVPSDLKLRDVGVYVSNRGSGISLNWCK